MAEAAFSPSRQCRARWRSGCPILQQRSSPIPASALGVYGVMPPSVKRIAIAVNGQCHIPQAGCLPPLLVPSPRWSPAVSRGTFALSASSTSLAAGSVEQWLANTAFSAAETNRTAHSAPYPRGITAAGRLGHLADAGAPHGKAFRPRHGSRLSARSHALRHHAVVGAEHQHHPVENASSAVPVRAAASSSTSSLPSLPSGLAVLAQGMGGGACVSSGAILEKLFQFKLCHWSCSSDDSVRRHPRIPAGAGPCLLNTNAGSLHRNVSFAKPQSHCRHFCGKARCQGSGIPVVELQHGKRRRGTAYCRRGGHAAYPNRTSRPTSEALPRQNACHGPAFLSKLYPPGSGLHAGHRGIAHSPGRTEASMVRFALNCPAYSLQLPGR